MHNIFCFEIRGMLPDEIQICFYDTSLNTAYSASIDNHLLNEVRELKGFNLSAWRLKSIPSTIER